MNNSIDYQNMFKKEFENYMLSKLNFSLYDKLITSSNLGFGDVNSSIKLKSGLGEFWNLNHFYILNNFNVNKLTKGEINILINGPDLQKQKLILSTYKKVLFSNYNNDLNDNRRFKINYTFFTSIDGFAYNDELVIGIYYGKNKYKYNSIKKYLYNCSEQEKYLNQISQNIIKLIKKEMDLSAKIIIYKV